jgi:hypothetical protein
MRRVVRQPNVTDHARAERGYAGTTDPLLRSAFVLAPTGVAACVPLGHSIVPRELRLWLGEFTRRLQKWHCQRVGPAPPGELCFTEHRMPRAQLLVNAGCAVRLAAARISRPDVDEERVVALSVAGGRALF